MQTKKFYLDNRVRIKDYYSENYDKIIARQKIYFKNSYNSDINFHLFRLTRCRIRRVLNTKLKPFGTVESLGVIIDTY